MLSVQKRSPRVANDPDKYIRPVKGGRFQARPYLEGERFNLGIFHTRHQARTAISLFWWGKLKDTPKYTKRIDVRGEVRYLTIVSFEGQVHKLGPFMTRDEAAAAAMGIVLGICGPELLDAALKHSSGNSYLNAEQPTRA